MDQQYNYYEEQPEKKGHIITGLFGALLGALVGAAVWAGAAIFLDIIAGIIGFLIGFLASKGYDLLNGRQGWAKLVCVIIAVIFGVVVGTGAAYAWLLHNDYNEQLAAMTEIQRRFYEIMTEKEFFIDNITNNPEFMSEVYKTLGLGLLFAALGCFDLLKEIVAKPAATANLRSDASVTTQSVEQAQPEHDSNDFSADA